jgi:hypothetical protein
LVSLKVRGLRKTIILNTPSITLSVSRPYPDRPRKKLKISGPCTPISSCKSATVFFKDEKLDEKPLLALGLYHIIRTINLLGSDEGTAIMANQSRTMAGITKSLLLGTTALAAVAVAPVAQAADPLKLSLGGFAEYYMVARSQRALER